MKTDRSISILKNIFAIVILVGLFSSFYSRAIKTKFHGFSAVPSAHGEIIVKNDNNNYYNIQVEIENLSEVEKQQTSKNSFVVRMETDQGRTITLGQIISSTAYLFNQWKASLETKSSFKPVLIFVTTVREKYNYDIT